MAVAHHGIATVGDNCVDVYSALSKSAVGGNALNVAVHLAREGIPVEYFGVVGDDANGRRVLRALDHNGIPAHCVRVRGGHTAVTELTLEPTGERTVLAEDFGVCADYVPDDEDLAALTAFRYVHCVNLPSFTTVRRALRAASRPRTTSR